MALPKDIRRTQQALYVISDEDCNVEIYRRNNNTYELVIIYAYTTSEIPYYLYPIEEDGLYLVKIEGTLADIEKTIPMFPTLIVNTANDFKSFVCDDCNTYLEDCNCSSITDLAKKAIKHNTLASKILYLEDYVVNGDTLTETLVTKYKDFVLSSIETVSCKSAGLIAKILEIECLTGAYSGNELYELEMIVRFLGIYLTEKNSDFDVTILDDETVPVMSELYDYTGWEECVCDTCLRLEELIAIYEEGIITDPDPIDNLPPTDDNIFREIVSSTEYYNYDLLALDFSDVYNDDNTSFPVTIIIEEIPTEMVLEDINDIPVTNGQIINFSDIENYRCNFQGAIVSEYVHYFKFRVTDGELQSPIYKFSFGLIPSVNNPPNVIKDFSISVEREVWGYIPKHTLLTEGHYTDPEGDEVTLSKIAYIQDLDVELWDGAAFNSAIVDDVIILADYTDNGEFLRVKYNSGVILIAQDIRTEDSPSFRLAFLDTGSNTYSNANTPGNVMNIGINLLDTTSLKTLFTGGWLTEAQGRKNWIPIARIEYDGDIRDLTSVLVSQSGYESAEVPLMLQVASSDLPYDIFKDPSSIVTDGSTNPPLNSYDILAYIDILATRTIVHKIQENSIDVLNITSSITLRESDGGEDPVTYVTNFLEFDETNIADFDYLETAFPPDFLGTVPRSVLPLVTADAIKGQSYIIQGAGLIGFSIGATALTEVKIFDNLNNDITNTVFKTFFDANKELELHISQNVYAPSTLYIRLQF